MEQNIQQPMRIWGILSTSWALFIKHFSAILIITLIIYIPVNILFEMLPSQEGWEGISMQLRLIQLLEGVFGILATMAVAYLVKAALDEKEIDYQTALKKAFNRWFQALFTNVLLGVCLFGLTLLFIIPGIIYYVFWIFTLYIVVFTEKEYWEAMKESMAIVQGRWWQTLGYAFVFGLLSVLVGFAAMIPSMFFPDQFAFTVLGDTIVDVFVSYFLVVSTVFYLEFNKSRPMLKEPKVYYPTPPASPNAPVESWSVQDQERHK